MTTEESGEGRADVAVLADVASIRLLLPVRKHRADEDADTDVDKDLDKIPDSTHQAVDQVREKLRKLIQHEVSTIRVVHKASCLPPPHLSSAAKTGATFRCDAASASGGRFPIFVQTPGDGNGEDFSAALAAVLEAAAATIDLKESARETSPLQANGLHQVQLVREGQIGQHVRKSILGAGCSANVDVAEVELQGPSWAIHILRQLSADSACSAVADAGVAGIDGFPVASFSAQLFQGNAEKQDGSLLEKEFQTMPSWFRPPVASKVHPVEVLFAKKREREKEQGPLEDGKALEEAKKSKVNKDWIPGTMRPLPLEARISEDAVGYGHAENLAIQRPNGERQKQDTSDSTSEDGSGEGGEFVASKDVETEHVSSKVDN